MELLAEWNVKDGRFLEKCKDRCLRLLESAREKKVFIEHVGFDKRLPAQECIRRLRLLVTIESGHLCYDKTWGFGVIQEVDLFYLRINIDFKRKSGHHLSLAYASETLELLGSDHILSKMHHDKDNMDTLVVQNPAEVVRLALKSFGPMPAPLLIEKLDAEILKEVDVKSFWDNARKELKKDPLVYLPTKRTEAIRILEKELAYDQDWFDTLAKERKLSTVIEYLEDLKSNIKEQELSSTQLSIIINRVEFVLKGASVKERGLMARALMAVHEIVPTEQAHYVEATTSSFFDEVLFCESSQQLPARFIKSFLQYLIGIDQSRTLDCILNVLPKLDVTTLNEAISVLLAHDQQEVCAQRIKKLLDHQSLSIELHHWLYRNVDSFHSWSLGTLPELAFQMLLQLEEEYTGERLKCQNQLRDRYRKKEWLERVLESMDEIQRRTYANKLKDTPAYPTMDRRSLLAIIIKKYPELQEIIFSKHKENQHVVKAKVTSTRTYNERKAQLEKIIKVEIPKNSKEIGVARSYGDLRENFEFKAAKDMQSLLLRREAELEQMLSEVTPSDFASYDHSKAGIATHVVIEFSDGRREAYNILGEWDRDEALNIISSSTRLALALNGHSVGR